MISSKNLIRIVINSFLGLILIFIWLKFVNIDQLITNIKTINPRFLFLFFILFVLSTVFRSLRLKYLLDKFKLEFKNLLYLNFISQFLSFIIPIRAGEIAKGVYLSSQMKDVGIIKSLLWVLIDRFLDFWGYILLVSLLIFIVPNNIPSHIQLIILAVALSLSITAILMICANQLSQKIISFFPHSRGIQNIASAFVILQRKPLGILRIIGLTFLAVTTDMLGFLLVYYSFDPTIDFGKVLLGSGLTVFTFLIPAAPGYVGSVEASNLAIFSGLIGFGANLVSSAAVVIHILNVITLPIFGLVSLYLLKFDLGQVWNQLRRD